MTEQVKLQAKVPGEMLRLSEEMAVYFGMNAGTLHADLWKHGFFAYLAKYGEMKRTEAIDGQN